MDNLMTAAAIFAAGLIFGVLICAFDGIRKDLW
jgi:hypothetical protein